MGHLVHPHIRHATHKLGQYVGRLVLMLGIDLRVLVGLLLLVVMHEELMLLLL